MKRVWIVTLTCALCLSGVRQVGASEECQKLHAATPEGLISYLSGIQPNDRNAECVTYAITRLGQQRYEPAIPTLARLLNFRRPPNAHEKNHIFLHPPILEEMYPAAGALEEFGKKALPVVLDVIKSSASTEARESAVSVWMFVYRENASKGVALLRQHASAAADLTTRQNLKSALVKAPTWCGPNEKARCTAAAVIKQP
jgi:hypothetical protein